jgi:hypothetical protein
MIGKKLLWVGLTMIIALPPVGVSVGIISMIGAILMIVGVVMFCVDK